MEATHLHPVSSPGHGAGYQRRGRLGVRQGFPWRQGSGSEGYSGTKIPSELASNKGVRGFREDAPTVCLSRTAGKEQGTIQKLEAKRKGERSHWLSACQRPHPRVSAVTGPWFSDGAKALLVTACQVRPQPTEVPLLRPRESTGLGGGGSTLHTLLLLRGHISG